MGVPTDVWFLTRLDGAECQHHLLVRATRPAFRNAVQAEADAADRVVARRHEAAKRQYLAVCCPAAHRETLIGELQVLPVGDVLLNNDAIEDLSIWVADTRHGPPWVALGTGVSEEAFWRAIAGEDGNELAALGPVPPARQLRVTFLPCP